MSGGGEDKKTKQKMELPEWYSDAAQSAIDMGNKVASGGYIPYIGADVAAMAPQTKAGLQGVDAMSAAFGMPNSGGASYMPEAQTFAGGIQGYSSAPAFEQSMEALKTKYPAAYDFISSFNKLGQGQSFNPSQSTAFQESLDPNFVSAMNALGNPSMPGINAPTAPGGAPSGGGNGPSFLLGDMGGGMNNGIPTAVSNFAAPGMSSSRSYGGAQSAAPKPPGFGTPGSKGLPDIMNLLNTMKFGA